MTTSNVTIHSGGEFHWVGNGFPVRSVFSYNDFGRSLSPFLLLDHAAPYRFAPGTEKRGVGEHPHRGFETVTIAYQGELEHRDSSGGGGLIGPGDVQWMTAASGLVHEEFHSEKFTREGGMFEVVQLWVNLPAEHKGAAPGYQTLKSADIPRIALPNGAGSLRVIAGEFGGRKGPARTFTPIELWDVTIGAGAETVIPMSKGYTKAILVLRGTMQVGEKTARAGDLAVLETEDTQIALHGIDESAALVLSGRPIDEPIVGYGPFVMNTPAEIKQAFTDYQAGKFGTFES